MNTGTSLFTSSSSTALFREWYQREPLIARFTLGVLALIPLLLLMTSTDERSLNGVNIWLKPLKFNIAIVLYLGTLVWYSGWIDRSALKRSWYKIYAWILCGTLFFMLPWLYGAALIGEPAHYNRTHPILAPIYAMMGVVSVIFTTGTVTVAALVATNKHSPLTTYFRHAVVWALLISFGFTVVLAGELAARDSHWIGGTASDANGLWPFGWSRDGGDLRVAHFFSLHAMHFVPLAALLTLPKPMADRPRLSALVMPMLYCGLIMYVYLQAKQGQPFLPGLG